MKVGIVGVGLIGGSVARALAAAGIPLWLADADSGTEAALRTAELGVVAPWSEWVADVDQVVVAVPMAKVGPLLAEMVPKMRPGTQLVDLSSLKSPLAGVLRAAAERVEVLALHAMAGREVSGFHASDRCLFQGSPLAVVDIGAGFPADHAVHWWEQCLGTETARYWSASQHDAHMAWVSQLPYLASRAVRVVVEQHFNGEPELIGPGYRDTTRVGTSPLSFIEPLLWANRAAVEPALAALAAEIDRWREIFREDSGPEF